MDQLKVEITAKLATTQSLLDKLDTSTWDAKDLEVFDTLVAEKRQSEKEHHKMTSGGSRLGRQVTPADLKQAAGDWRYDTETAGYIYVGNGPCALDRFTVQQCHHDICKEAKSKEGVSYMEYDTIIHYSQRITNAKSDRMRSALQKQRDIQLMKDKEAGQEWKEKAIKKFKYLGKDACEALLTAAQQFDKTLTLPLVAPPERPDTAIEQVGRALSEMRVASLKTEDQRFLSIALQLVIKTDATQEKGLRHWRDTTDLFEYFKNVEYAHMEGVIMNIRDVMALNCIIPYELDHKLLLFLEEIQDLMQNLDRGTRTMPGLTVQQAFQELLKELKTEADDTAFNDFVPKGYLYYALRQCSIVDSVMREKLLKVSDANPVLTGQKLDDALQVARDDASSKSPFPSMTIDCSEQNFERCRQRALIHHIVDTLHAANKKDAHKASNQKLQLNNRLSNVFKQNLSDRGLPKFKEDARLRAEILIDFKKNREYQEVVEAIHTAEKIAWEALPGIDRKEQIKMEDLEAKISTVSAQLIAPTFVIQQLPGIEVEDSVQIILKYARAFYSTEKRHLVVRQSLSRGICEFYLAFQTICICDNTFRDTSYIRAVEMKELTENVESHLKTFTRQGQGTERFLYERYLEGWCLAKTMVRLTILLSHLSAYNPLTAKGVLKNMALLAKSGMHALPPSWLPLFRVIAQGVLQIYGYLMLEAARVFGRADVDQFVLSSIWVILLHALVAKSACDGIKQFIRIWHFILDVLDVSRELDWVKHVEELFEEMVDLSEIRCDHASKCGTDVERLKDPTIVVPLQIETVPTSTHQVSISSHGDTLRRLVESEGFHTVAAGRVLKYIAFRISEALRYGVTRQDLEYLWYAFVKSEHQIGRNLAYSFDAPDASSMHLCMHNGCNIWELFSSKEKACGFFEGYRLGYRTAVDIEAVLRSLTNYAFSYGSKTRATRKVQKLFVPLIFPGSIFDMFKEHIEKLRDFFDECTNENCASSLDAQIYMNRLDHLIAAGMSVQNPKYLHELQRYCNFVFGKDAEISQNVSSLLTDMQTTGSIAKEDNRFDYMAHFWKNLEAPHIDVIYSDDETDTDLEGEDFDPFVLEPLGGFECEFETNSSMSVESAYEPEVHDYSFPDYIDGKPVLLSSRLRPVSEPDERNLSTVNATAHTKRRSTIMIEMPETVPRGRDVVIQPQLSRNVKDRSPTPFPRLPSSLKTSSRSKSNSHSSPNRSDSVYTPAIDETTIPELLVDISDDDSDLDDFSPFERPPEGKFPVFCSLLRKNSTLLDQMQDLENLLTDIKCCIISRDHPLRAMITSEDEDEKERTTAMFDQVHLLGQQMEEFQRSLGLMNI